MGIKFRCPNGHKIHVKTWMAGKRGMCPACQAKVEIPTASSSEFAAEDSDSQLIAATGKAAASSGIAMQPAAAASASPAVPHIAMPQLGGAANSPQPAASAFPASTLIPTPGGAIPLRDPLAEVPQAQWYVRHASGQQYGPAQSPTFGKWISDGRVPGDALVWREGWSDWRPAAAIFSQLAVAGRGPHPLPLAPAARRAAEPDPLDFSDPHRPAEPNAFVYRRKDNSTMVLLISIGLLLLVAILGGIFAMVLMREPPKADGAARAERPAAFAAENSPL